ALQPPAVISLYQPASIVTRGVQSSPKNCVKLFHLNPLIPKDPVPVRIRPASGSGVLSASVRAKDIPQPDIYHRAKPGRRVLFIIGDLMTRARLRDLGITIGTLPTGPYNAITDVPGVLVGQVSLIADEP